MHTHRPAWLSAHWPSQCLVCRRWPARPLCDDCRTRFAHQPPRCHTCGLGLPGITSNILQCGQCLLHPPPLRSCTVAVDYGYPWALLLRQWKFHATPALSRHLVTWFAAHGGLQSALDQCSVTLPIPLSAQRLRERGYNQALLLARALHCPHIETQWLQRSRDTLPQSRQNRAGRLRNLRGVFTVPPQALPGLAGRQILLVDDVITTGATLHAAAQALLQAGAAGVHAVALARTP